MTFLIGSIFYFVSVQKEKQFYAEQEKKYTDLKTSFTTIKQRCDDIEKLLLTNKISAQTDTDIKKLNNELSQVKEKLPTFEERAIIIQQLIKGPENIIYEKLQKFIDSCEALDSKLTKNIKCLEAESVKRENAKKIVIPPKEEKKEKAKKDLPSPPQKDTTINLSQKDSEKAQTKQKKDGQSAQSKGANTKKDNPVTLPIADERYLWTKSEDIHTLVLGKNVEIHVGSIVKDSIRINLYNSTSTESKPKFLDKEIICSANSTEFAYIICKYKIGILTFELNRNTKPPSDDCAFLITITEKDKVIEMPLYFRLGTSKLKPPKDYAVNINKEGNINITITGLEMPKKFYNENNSLSSSPVLKLSLPNQSIYTAKISEITIVGQFSFTLEDQMIVDYNKMKQDAANKIKDYITNISNNEKIIKENLQRDFKLLNPSEKNELDTYLKLHKTINDNNTCKILYKEFNIKNKEQGKDLYDILKQNNSKSKNETATTWIKNYDELDSSKRKLKSILGEYPKKFDEKIQNRIEKLKENNYDEIRTALKEASIDLVLKGNNKKRKNKDKKQEDKTYIQFYFKDIKGGTSK